MDIPLIRKFACGYVQGVKAANPKAEVFQNMPAPPVTPGTDPVKGGELAKSQFDRGADIVYHAAGATGLGVLQAAAEPASSGIGVDSNQDYLHPATYLTSMMKRVDNAVFRIFKRARTQAARRRRSARPSGGRRRLVPRRVQREAHHPGHEDGRRQGAHRDHRRHAEGARLHHRPKCPVE